ncbi:MAG: LysM peptidoglycan-binding domain-containing M23 family metallopeptidase [Deltaproteobacteria bacterium]|nr:LysM peptidoglycan-binding domain-containing M23 family metallopeptidase [Deltaproteobacteria bacterium]MBW2386582.1 LysM peptidoglycan-binding domain-containing M23 family metallopeptidase [Deltaproteobacteria bacterium]
MSIRRPDRRERLGGLTRLARLLRLGLVLALAAVTLSSCARYSQGFYHTIRPGENLYRIGLRYGVPADTLAEANNIRDVTTISVGQRIWIPQLEPARSGHARVTNGHSANVDSRAAARARRDVRREASRSSELIFGWPMHTAKVTSRFGRRRGRAHEGIDIGAPRGSRIVAAESGKVIHAGWLGDYGRVVIVKHSGDYRTVYAHANKLHVRRGQLVDKGERIADVGTSGNASGPHLHFEIRHREAPKNPMLYLP